MTAVLSAVFFASGASALIFETLWFRQAGLAFGSSVWASSLVLSGFMAGLAFGNALAAGAGGRLRRPVRAYAIAEAIIALTGVGLVYLLPVLGSVLAPLFRPLLDQPWAINPLRLLIAFLLLLIPSTAMGITLPLLTRALMRDEGSFGRVLGWLYGWNTLGAMVGVVAGELFLVGKYGVRGTALVAGALNLLAASVAGLLSGGSASPESSAPRNPPYVPTRLLISAFLAGFCLLALEVVWFRFLLLFVKGHSSAFPVTLGVVLAGIALGGLTASLWMRVAPAAYRWAAVLAFVAAVATVVSYARFPSVIAPFGSASITRPGDILRISLPLMLPVSFISGMFFPIVGAAMRSSLGSGIETAGVLTFVNTVGAAAGSLVAGFAMLPALGIEKSIFAIAVCYAVVGAALSAGSGRTRPPLSIAAAAVACIIALATYPFGQLNERLVTIPVDRWAEGEGERRLVAVREGLTETIVFFQRLFAGKPVSDVMLTNSFSMSTNGYGVRRYQKLYVYWPLAVRPDIRHALLIGYGVGNTAKALTDSAGVESIDLVDLSRDILAMAPITFPDEREQPLRDRRMRIHIEDGRYFLQTTDRRFDLITGEPPPPGIAGVEHLYSREYFQLIDDALADRGIVTYWLPLADLSDVSTKAILRAFCDVFEDCSLWNGSGTNLMMVGSHGPGAGVPVADFGAQWNTPRVAAEMRRLGFERPEQLGALFIGDARFVRALAGDAPALTDDTPKLIEAPFSSPTAGTDMLAAITDTGAAATRFQSSALIATLWPKTLLGSSVPYFDVQRIVNAHMYGGLLKPAMALEDVHRVLTGTSVAAPVLWRLASNADIQQVVSSAAPQEQMQPLMQYHVAIRLLSERSYRQAADAFERATAAPEVRDNAFVLRVYSLCMAGQRARAQQISHEAFAASGVSSLPPLWIWMRDTFGIDPSRR